MTAKKLPISSALAIACAMLISSLTLFIWQVQRDVAAPASTEVRVVEQPATREVPRGEEARGGEEEPAPRVPVEDAVVPALPPVRATSPSPGAGPAQQTGARPKYKMATLVIIANYEKATVTINGRPYSGSTELTEEGGVLLPAGGPHKVVVTYMGKSKEYEVSLRPGERRYLLVEIPGYVGGAALAPAPVAPQVPTPAQPEVNAAEEKKEGEPGRVTIYAKPRGQIMVDGKEIGKGTPNTIEVEDGRHEVQVRYEGGELSESKIVRSRSGSRVKLFFRQRVDQN